MRRRPVESEEAMVCYYRRKEKDLSETLSYRTLPFIPRSGAISGTDPMV